MKTKTFFIASSFAWLRRRTTNQCFLVFYFSCVCNYAVALTYTVGTAGNYATLSAAFTDINAGTITGAITLNIISDISGATVATLNANSAPASYTSVLIQSSGGAWTITGSEASNGIIRFNGAGNVTIDGLNSGGNALTIENTSTSTGSALTSTLLFRALASTNITVQNCTIKGSGRRNGGGSDFNTGTILFSTGSSNNITITNCNITASGGNTPFNAIFIKTGNYNITISYCNISDYFVAATGTAAVSSYGIYINNSSAIGGIGTGGAQSFVIDHNNFFQTSARTTDVKDAGIAKYYLGAICVMTTSTTGIDITNNVIGHTSTVGSMDMTYSYTGAIDEPLAPWFLPIMVSGLGNGTTTNITGNTIAGISYTTTSRGGDGTVFSSSRAPGVFTAIYVTPAPPVYGDKASALTPTVNIGGTAADRSDGNSIGLSAYPITVSSSATTTPYVAGIWAAISGTCNVQNNTVSALRLSESGAGTTMDLSGIIIGHGLNNIQGNVKRNKVYDLDFVSGTANRLRGIVQFASEGATGLTFSNNMISLITSYANCNVYGIHDMAQNDGIKNYYFNSVYLGGTATATYYSYAWFSQNGGSDFVTLKNNLFFNNRTGSTTNYCFGYSWGLQNAGFVSNYNILANPQNAATIGDWGNVDQTFAAWKTASGGDANSFTGMANPFANTSTGDLHITYDMSVTYPGNNPTSGITIDCDPADIRNVATPDIGADEYGSLLPVELLSFSGMCDGDKIRLRWQTASEKNNDYFSIQRSADGIYFETIGTVTGAGNSNTVRHYEFMDTDFSSQTYYRLKQTDFNGENAYYGSVSVDPGKCTSNPINVLPTVSSDGYFIITGKGKAGICVYTVLGQKIVDVKDVLLPFVVDLAAYNADIYIVQINSGGFAESKRVMMIR